MTASAPPWPTPRPPHGDDLTWMLDLNNAHARELSWLTEAAFHDLINTATHVAVVSPVAFVVCFDQNSPYFSPNFVWHQQRFDRFLYVDRVVVDPVARGAGIARQLYDGVFAAATAAALPRVVAEISADPPNPASDAFHDRLGFTELGRARLDDQDKIVRYVAAQTPA